MGEVVDFPNVTAEQRQRLHRQQVLHDGSRLSSAIGRLEAATYSKLGNTTKARLAENLGALVDSRRGLHGASRRAVSGKAFRDQDLVTIKNPGRLVRYSGEPGAAEALHAQGGGYVSFARAVDRAFPLPGVTVLESWHDAALTLLRGSEFDPDPARSQQVAIDSKVAVIEVLARIRNQVVTAAPQLAQYFNVTAEQRLSARQIGLQEISDLEDRELAELNYKQKLRWMSSHNLPPKWQDARQEGVMKWRDWDDWVRNNIFSDAGLDAFGFDPDAFESVLPELNDPLRGCDLVPELLHDGLWLINALSGLASTWPRICLGVVELVSSTAPLADGVPLADKHAFWLLHLALAPIGGCEPEQLQLVLYAEPLLDEFPSNYSDASHPNHPQGMPVGYERLRTSASAIWVAPSRDALDWLLLKTIPAYGLAAAESGGFGPQLLFEPFFAVPHVLGQASARTIGGLIERNALHAPPSDTIAARLIDDAHRRLAAQQSFIASRAPQARSPNGPQDQNRQDPGPQ